MFTMLQFKGVSNIARPDCYPPALKEHISTSMPSQCIAISNYFNQTSCWHIALVSNNSIISSFSIYRVPHEAFPSPSRN